MTVLEEFVDRVQSFSTEELSDRDFIQRVMRHLHNRVGHDFTEYKSGTLLRRVAVRMSILGQERTSEYLRYLIDDPKEADLLFDSVLINVTSFFRDVDTFRELRDVILPALIERAGSHGDLRIWVAGCATGEEAYSYGIAMFEAMERLNIWPSVSIFGTDIDNRAACCPCGALQHRERQPATARHGAEILIPHANGYVISERLRNIVRFSSQSLIKDPPFSQIDLLSCRNVMIYFQTSLQDSVAKAFHYSLRENGILVLGNSETITRIYNLFEETSRSHHIFRRLPGPPSRLELRAADRIFDKAGQEDPTDGPPTDAAPAHQR